ncbi:MAG: pyruvate, phosphate dikinase [archaeon]|nr:pyruvate, phosphate dikinase [archaeon]
MTMHKRIYLFEEASVNMRDLLGNKGAQIAEMTRIGLPVPVGFTITTETCKEFYKCGKKFPRGLGEELMDKVRMLEAKTGKRFGDPDNPLLFSVRSGAAISMPGMMDTVLNLGLNEKTIKGLIKQMNEERFAYDCYRRFVQMYGDVVLSVSKEKFELVLDKYKEKLGVKTDAELSADALKEIVVVFKKIIKEETGGVFPEDPHTQLKMSIEAIFNSWNNPRAITYRRINNLPHDLGTGVNVQIMVFGNVGGDSATGVAFTRDPATGEKKLFAEYLVNAQGEDVVAGVRTPKDIEGMKEEFPEAYDALANTCKVLEKHYKDVQDTEFTVERKKFYILQTRAGKRTAQAAVKIAVDMVAEGLIDKKTAILRVEPEQLNQLLHPMIDSKVKLDVIAKGLPASPGAAVGKAVFDSEKASEMGEMGEKVVLVRLETSPDDIGGMAASKGILTVRGGMTSHAAIVGRGMGKCCVVGCSDIIINENDRSFKAGNVLVKEGDYMTLNGNTGEVILGKVELVEPKMSGSFEKLMDWADSVRKLKVKTNADTSSDAQVARDFGAEGIGLCRTEHMFFEGDRIKAIREMILSDTPEERKRALAKVQVMQKEDFKGIFKVMDGLPVIIRLLDPPLHEFLPKEDDEIREFVRQMNVDAKKIKDIVTALHEFNPMLGFRGCRLGIRYPEINEMQAKAIFEAALECQKQGIKVKPQIEVPLVGEVKEFRMIKEIIEKAAEETGAKGKIIYETGTMIEVPRAAITADKIAKEADFMSFGTNDLTQMTCGFSRDDAGKFLKLYVDSGIYKRDPFQSIDTEGVGLLMKMCVDKARKVKPDIEIGICGEHGGDPASIEFCYKIGLSDVSCSPFRVLIARLAAAQAALKE